MELKLFDQVLVLSLGETTTFIGIKEYVVNKETGITERIRSSVGLSSMKFSEGTEFYLKFDLMVVYTLSFDIL